MTTVQAQSTYRSYAATPQHGTALIEPAWGEYASRFTGNRQLLAGTDCEFAGWSFDRLRTEARQELIRAATRYTSEYRNVSLPGDEPGLEALDAANLTSESRAPVTPVLMAGHQPELFHPGVWFKNFALSRLGELLGATPVNLVVDNDLCGATAVRVPSKVDGTLRRTSIPFDQPVATPVPFEQRWLADRETFAAFPSRVKQALPASLQASPSLDELWPAAIAAVNRCGNIACAIAQSRHALEEKLGLNTLEVPLSVVCRTRSFATFMLSLLGQLPRLHECYNESLHEYRVVHGIRSQAHPVPELRQEGEWFEAPLWIYGDDDPVRRPAWGRWNNGSLEISDRHQRLLRIDQEFDTAAAAEQLLALTDADCKLRPRALVTTMYGRLVLSDMFLHGIGGAKYDQLGDRITRRFFGLTPPSFGVLSATVMLPHASAASSDRSVQEVTQELRDTEFSPERFAQAATMDADLLAEKQQLLSEIPPKGHRKPWHDRMTEVNRRLSGALGVVRGQLMAELQQAREGQRENLIWTSREHPFPIFSLAYLTETFSRLLP